jgi:mercuric ion transport protein
MLRTLGGYVLALTALVACPCHLPFTLPLLLALVGGTSLGAFLREQTGLVFLGALGYFLFGLAAAFWLLGRRAAGGGEAGASSACCPPASPAGAGRARQSSEVDRG